jgi:GDP-mannose transporter
MYYNNILNIPVLALSTLLFENWSSTNVSLNFPSSSRTSQCIAMIYSGLCTIFISYASAWCIRITSSTTYSMVGALNKLPIAVVGLLFFGTKVTLGGTAAIVLGFVSGVLYAWAKNRQSGVRKGREEGVVLPVREKERTRSLSLGRE